MGSGVRTIGRESEGSPETAAGGSSVTQSRVLKVTLQKCQLLTGSLPPHPPPPIPRRGHTSTGPCSSETTPFSLESSISLEPMPFWEAVPYSLGATPFPLGPHIFDSLLNAFTFLQAFSLVSYREQPKSPCFLPINFVDTQVCYKWTCRMKTKRPGLRGG